ncbi:zinc ribbon domain-containing protein [Candidatus Woesearchaeota archaeon]|nr:zinc ribbon domain-containing protein [Candidatus Woesearchaeota archaeon]
MARIHGLVYAALGLFVSVFSWKLNYEKLVFFFYIGLVFIAIGTAKIILGLAKKRTSKLEKSRHKENQKRSKYCPKCGNGLKADDIFCSRCGSRI